MTVCISWNNKKYFDTIDARCKHEEHCNLLQLMIPFKLTDLSVGLISVLTDIVWRATVAWYAGNAACKIIRFLQVRCY
jgi:hypothetical protein